MVSPVTANYHGSCMEHTFIPPKPTIAELERKARECEERAECESEPAATVLREEAKKYRDWAVSLRTGRWTA